MLIFPDVRRAFAVWNCRILPHPPDKPRNMKPLISQPNPAQPGVFRPRPLDIIAPNHPLVKLADAVDWRVFERDLKPFFSHTGRQAKPVCLMVGLNQPAEQDLAPELRTALNALEKGTEK